MEIIKGIDIIDLALFIKKEKILIIGDLHLGIEESYREAGILLPKFYYQDLKERLQKILEKTKPKLVVINGDIKHEFGKISQEEWSGVFKLIDFLFKYGKIIFIKGNHDKVIRPIAEKKNIPVFDYYKVRDICICHGDFIPKGIEKSKVIIIGHEHPAISLEDSIKKEVYKCYLRGKFKKKDLIVMPSFNMFHEGSNVLKGKFMGPFLRGGIRNFEAFLVGDRVYKFGKIKNLYPI